MHRLFLDANVLFSAAFRANAPLRRLWNRSGVELVTSAYAVVEAERHLDAEQRTSLTELMKDVQVVPDAPSQDLPAGVMLRGKDVPILVTAIANRATHLITGDRRDFGRFFGKRLGGVLVLPRRDYFESMRREPRRPRKKR